MLVKRVLKSRRPLLACGDDETINENGNPWYVELHSKNPQLRSLLFKYYEVRFNPRQFA